jgi:hypothetical protein
LPVEKIGGIEASIGGCSDSTVTTAATGIDFRADARHRESDCFQFRGKQFCLLVLTGPDTEESVLFSGRFSRRSGARSFYSTVEDK